MAQSGILFGTSGARGLSDHMTDFICYAYTRGFLQYLQKSIQDTGRGRKVAIAGDLRPSTDRIMQAVANREIAQRAALLLRIAVWLERSRIAPFMACGIALLVGATPFVYLAHVAQFIAY